MKKASKRAWAIVTLSLMAIVFCLALLEGAQAVPDSGQKNFLRYEIWVELDDAAKMLKGKEDIFWLNHTREEISDVWLHLY